MARTRVIGLDIGTTHVRAAELEFGKGGPSREGSATVLRVAEEELPRGAVRDGEVAEPETVATALRRLWARARFSHKDVVIGIGNQRVIVRDLELPWMPATAIQAALPYQVEDLLPVAIEDALLDYVTTGTRTGEHGQLLQGLLVAATKETVLANTAAVEAAGLRPVMVDLGAFALSRVMTRGDVAERTVALLDIGAKVTTVCITAQGTPQFVRMLPMGGHDVTDAVAIALGVSRADAEQVKKHIGVGSTVPADQAAAAERIATVTTSLVEAVRNTLVYYASNHPGAAAELVVLTGGGSQLPGLGQYLASVSRMPVTHGQPLSTLQLGGKGGGLDPDLVGAQHSLAIPLGLAFGAAA